MNDLISRQAAIDAMCELIRHWFGGDPKDEVREINRKLRKLPSAEPERKKGRWIDMGDHVMCSCCGATHYGADKNYCPNCGAEMEGEE